jgi:hypothetical protein
MRSRTALLIGAGVFAPAWYGRASPSLRTEARLSPACWRPHSTRGPSAWLLQRASIKPGAGWQAVPFPDHGLDAGVGLKVGVGLSRMIFSRSDEALLLTILGITVVPSSRAWRRDSKLLHVLPAAPMSARTPNKGFLHCGARWGSHFVKMVHNGIEYGMMAAYAEGLAVLRNADIGKAQETTDAESAPPRDSQFYRYELDTSEIAEVWRRGMRNRVMAA